MAKLLLEGDELVVSLTPLEKFGALSGDVRVPRSSITRAGMTDKPYRVLRGIRVGTGIPFVIVLGRMFHGSGADFVAVYGTGRTAVIELTPGQRYTRILVSGADEQVVGQLNGGRGGAPAPKT